MVQFTLNNTVKHTTSLTVCVPHSYDVVCNAIHVAANKKGKLKSQYQNE